MGKQRQLRALPAFLPDGTAVTPEGLTPASRPLPSRRRRPGDGAQKRPTGDQPSPPTAPSGQQAHSPRAPCGKAAGRRRGVHRRPAEGQGGEDGICPEGLTARRTTAGVRGQGRGCSNSGPGGPACGPTRLGIDSRAQRAEARI